jgi:hypothetical protein
MDAVRLGSAFRAVRIRLCLRQVDVARRAGSLFRVASSLEIYVDLIPRWRGGELPRMLNAGHSALHEATARLPARMPAWTFAPEVSFAVYGERGVIDVLAYHRERRALLVIELKTDLVDVQGLLGSIDRYRRLARGVANDRGWEAASVSVWVLLTPTRIADASRRMPRSFVLRSPDSRFSQMLVSGALAGFPRAFGVFAQPGARDLSVIR